MNQTEAVFLQDVFVQIDLAVVERVIALQGFQAPAIPHAPYNRHEREIRIILRHLGEMTVPARLTHVHRLVVEAIQDQHDYFSDWHAARERKTPFQPGLTYPAVERSSQKLRAVYEELKRLYPRENKQNTQSFYDYPCALDFVCSERRWK